MWDRRCLVISLAAVAACVTLVNGQAEPSTTPSTVPADAQQLVVVVSEVVGMAQVRFAPGEKWQAAVVGMELSAGAEVRTGHKSRVVCRISDDQVLTLQRLGTISILEAYRERDKDTTDMIMKYGRTDYAIEKAGKEHDATIRTPNSTLSVRGTDFTAYDQPPFAPQMETRRGLVDFRHNRRLMSVGAGGRAKGNSGPAEVALESSVVDPADARARTTGEAALIANEISRGAVLGFDPFTQIATLSGGLGPQTDTQLLAALPGRLNFVIRWETPGTDFNLAVLKLAGDPLEVLGAFLPQEVLYPGFGLDRTVSGGRIALDHRGGPNGGQEIGFYNNVESGIYGLQALHAGGPGGVVSFSAFLDGQAQTLFATRLDENGDPIPNDNGFGFQTEFSTRITRRVEPGGLEVATALIPFPDFLLPEGESRTIQAVPNATPDKASMPGRTAKPKPDKRRPVIADTLRLAPRPQPGGKTGMADPRPKGKRPK